ncbi:Phosphatidylinositol 4-phosphate 5-kinase [Quillaja saponaria]|uniref:Phosphatidylinositol 4-phosphate 5-kinase n=1 Tax=Quillaja saponaria TaxID=32244 RepID=A0AAD7Q731_QUISA|nr:Phosphatidylinositol 4-phosphate 5-kinase [Quillaja saponaria]
MTQLFASNIFDEYEIIFGLFCCCLFPFFYFVVSHLSHSFLFDFLSAFAFSAALLLRGYLTHCGSDNKASKVVVKGKATDPIKVVTKEKW